MGLIRGVARTAAIAGTATAVSNRVSRRQAGRWAAQDQAAQAPPEQAYAEPAPQAPPAPPPAVYYQAAPPPPAPPVVDMDTKLEQLKDLGQLRDQGVLSEAEFEAQKSRILAG
jgi:Short C-terminal domain